MRGEGILFRANDKMHDIIIDSEKVRLGDEVV